MLLEGKKLLITGVLDRKSIAYSIAEEAQKAGAEIVLTSFGRVMSITQMMAKRLPVRADVLELDATKREDVTAVCEELERRWGRLDGWVHSIAFAPEDALGGNFLNTPWESAATAFRISAFSLKEIAVGLLPLMKEHGGSIVTLDFDNSVHAWPSYDWMGVSKAALASIVRYLARDLGHYGIRVNAVSAGPMRTIAAKGVPGFAMVEEAWGKQAPLGWDTTDPRPVGRTICALLSDYMPATTGEVIHVDGGRHAVGAEMPGKSDHAVDGGESKSAGQELPVQATNTVEGRSAD
ncbi:MAG: enoyl-[acyl-carrier-protein] reductase FabI [Candidatus Nephthysia bennettiae]|uniref:Enoyl-[acyl-carrier-protein] reductase [NADH] n=1 Tax=Candidatus Nephthysia bennettiae TaxID=3127016 RepID=A0A934NFY0_9BACT|nr:enoyl-ACP reductase FabI [Candidatus Dormibacteraeota bacterium]MBJ7610947.1 enoyl-ACP reductase FabI [Candidatus Dormibacteraeota bacterium]PZR92703.1 MAG: enoyl-[acyl-carrier-protein] reductase FabI [Candidatus Dormibacteraeota bacterium]